MKVKLASILVANLFVASLLQAYYSKDPAYFFLVKTLCPKGTVDDFHNDPELENHFNAIRAHSNQCSQTRGIVTANEILAKAILPQAIASLAHQIAYKLTQSEDTANRIQCSIKKELTAEIKRHSNEDPPKGAYASFTGSNLQTKIKKLI